MAVRSLTLIHSLPGRIRLRVAPGLSSFDEIQERVKLHPGIYLLSYNSTTNSILAQFDTNEIDASELVVRIAVAISVCRGLSPVAILTKPARESVDQNGLVSGLSILAAAGAAVIRPLSPATPVLKTVAAATTALAILNHAWREYRERGDFHPETLSVVYLGSAFFRGTALPAAVVAWLATFALHFTGTAPEHYVVRVTPSQSEGEYDAEVRRERSTSQSDSMLQFVVSLIADAVSGTPSGPESFLGQIKEVSRKHESLLEGLEGLEQNIRISIT